MLKHQILIPHPFPTLCLAADVCTWISESSTAISSRPSSVPGWRSVKWYKSTRTSMRHSHYTDILHLPDKLRSKDGDPGWETDNMQHGNQMKGRGEHWCAVSSAPKCLSAFHNWQAGKMKTQVLGLLFWERLLGIRRVPTPKSLQHGAVWIPKRLCPWRMSISVLFQPLLEQPLEHAFLLPLQLVLFLWLLLLHPIWLKARLGGAQAKGQATETLHEGFPGGGIEGPILLPSDPRTTWRVGLAVSTLTPELILSSTAWEREPGFPFDWVRCHVITVPASQVSQECFLPLREPQPFPVLLRQSLLFLVLWLEKSLSQRCRKVGARTDAQTTEVYH